MKLKTKKRKQVTFFAFSSLCVNRLTRTAHLGFSLPSSGRSQLFARSDLHLLRRVRAQLCIGLLVQPRTKRKRNAARRAHISIYTRPDGYTIDVSCTVCMISSVSNVLPAIRRRKLLVGRTLEVQGENNARTCAERVLSTEIIHTRE